MPDEEWIKTIADGRNVKLIYQELPVDGAFLTAQLAGNEVVYSIVLTRASNVVAEKRDFQIMQPNERTTTAGNRVGNKILLSISDKEYALIRPHLEFLSMPHHLSLYEPGQPLEFVHFPNTGMVSLVIATEDGKTVEVGEVGKEGFARGTGGGWHKQEPSA